MASSYSFDVVSDFDRQDLVNAVDRAMREVKTRYDLKSSKSTLDLDDASLTINTDSDLSLKAIQDILRIQASKSNLSQKIFEFGTPESASGNRIRQVVTLKKGIEKELAKKMVKQIRDAFKKVQASIQGDSLRVSAKDKDVLQAAIQLLKESDYPVPLQFTNYR
ncbi:YajQ family cyclic di-GMP-binding protein [Synechococcus sp. PCC 7336]|uniref:YajQ family cyclic di-GMP-binding protein n=1 Tax=Synechococcus sp. PCC 7336 TaxID=195250 RepID=UPI000349209C|nr:YajQ family cyclic di-GMP-binding protein [Synechococcus sp. PCC 7336]